MNFIHVSDLDVLKDPPSHPQPVNLDKVSRIHVWNNMSYHKIYFRTTDGNDDIWDFKTQEDFDIYYERILSLLNSNDISQMTKL